MGEEKSGKKETRPVLGEITNQLGKRGLGSVSSSPKSASKSGVGNKRSAEHSSNDQDSNFWKQVSKVAESLEKERYGSPKCPKIVSQSGLSPLSGGKTYRLRTASSGGGGSSAHGKPQPGHPDPTHEATKHLGSGVERVDLGKSQTLPKFIPFDTVKESIPGFAVSESSKLPQKSLVEGGKDCQAEETVVVSDSGENDLPQDTQTTKVLKDDGKRVDGDSLLSSRSGSVVSSKLIASQDKEALGLKRCVMLKGDGCSSSAPDLELLKSCSCSFCTKAAYILSDLHYQDVKGRISVLNKSQKEASMLAQRYSGENERPRHGQKQSTKDPNLEDDLKSQWRSLFLHMENIFAGESSQLQTDLLALKDLREDFKNPEPTAVMPSNVQQYSSDASDQ